MNLKLFFQVVLTVLVITIVGVGVAILVLFLTRPENSGSVTKGANSYYLWACDETYQKEAFAIMQLQKMEQVRIFLLSTRNEGYPGECDPLEDIENPVGVFQNQTIDRVNQFLALANTYGIKVIVALHDRWSLGCWRNDAYAVKYNITYTPGCDETVNNPSVFYTSPEARNDYKQRLLYLMAVKNPYMNGTEWRNLSVIHAFDVENEYQMGLSVFSNHAWLCEMATFLKSLTTISVTNGGGGFGLNIPFSSDVIGCAAIDLISVHDYNQRPISDAAFVFYGTFKKPVLLEEFGSTSVVDLAQHVQLAKSYGMNWLVWSLDKSGKSLSLWNITDPRFSVL